MLDYLSSPRADLEKEQLALQARYQAFVARGLKLDMSRGKPSPDQLDLSMGLFDITDTVDDTGLDVRNYGTLEGCPEARRFFAEMLGVKPEETLVGGNASLALMYTMVDMGMRAGFSGAAPWDGQKSLKFLCPAPGYDRHFRITETFGFELLSVPMGPTGPDMDMVEKLAANETVKGIWCVPVYSNPDGYTYSAETVERLAKMKAAKDFRIFWDNAYMVHNFRQPLQACPNILDACRAAGCEDRPLMFCSTSKMTFAGAGVCAMAASAANVGDIVKYLFPSIISFDKVNQLRHTRFFRQAGGIAAHMQRHAAIIGPKFELLYEALGRGLEGCGEIARWTEPSGGYFFSLYTLEGCAKRTVELCKQAGVVLTGAGAAFPYGKDPADNHIRIAPSFPSLDELKTAAELLCIALRLASTEKLLGQ